MRGRMVILLFIVLLTVRSASSGLMGSHLPNVQAVQ